MRFFLAIRVDVASRAAICSSLFVHVDIIVIKIIIIIYIAVISVVLTHIVMDIIIVVSNSSIDVIFIIGVIGISVIFIVLFVYICNISVINISVFLFIFISSSTVIVAVFFFSRTIIIIIFFMSIGETSFLMTINLISDLLHHFVISIVISHVSMGNVLYNSTGEKCIFLVLLKMLGWYMNYPLKILSDA